MEMQLVEIRPGVFLRLRPEDVKRYGHEVVPQNHKAAAPAAVKKAASKKSKPATPVTTEEGPDDGSGNDN